MRFYRFLSCKGTVPKQGNFRSLLTMGNLEAHGAFCWLAVCLFGLVNEACFFAETEQEVRLDEVSALAL